MRYPVETNNPGPSRPSSQAFVICGEPGQALLQLPDDGVQVVEHSIGKLLLAQFIPDMFLRIQFGCVGRQAQQPDVLGDRQVFGLGGTGTVQP